MDRQLVVLARAGNRDGVEHKRGTARQHLPVIGGGVPGQHLRRHRPLNKAVTNFTVSSVCGVLIVRLPSGSCSCEPNEYMIARIAMAVSISADSPIPTGMPVLSLIFLPPMRISSQESGFIPASPHRSIR